METIEISLGLDSHVLYMDPFECPGCHAPVTSEMWMPAARRTYVASCACGAEYRWTEGAETIRCRLAHQP